jgi:hypothetical protein
MPPRSNPPRRASTGRRASPVWWPPFYVNANDAGLFNPSQVQALNVGVPLIQRDPATGVIKLTIGVKETTDLSLPFTDFPMNAPGTDTFINPQGKLEFEFTVRTMRRSFVCNRNESGQLNEARDFSISESTKSLPAV